VCFGSLAAAASGDGQLAVVRSMSGHLVRVWVLGDGAGGWQLRRTMDVRKLLRHLPYDEGRVRLSAFCPRSGCVLGSVTGQDLCTIVRVGLVCVGKIRLLNASFLPSTAMVEKVIFFSTCWILEN
jgi:hypothetical protein